MNPRDFRQLSRQYTVANAAADVSVSDVQLGAILRIADAVETLTKSYEQLSKNRDWYKSALEREQESHNKTRRSHQALRSTITRMKNKERKNGEVQSE